MVIIPHGWFITLILAQALNCIFPKFAYTLEQLSVTIPEKTYPHDPDKRTDR
jgi:hypothetical protein